MRAFWMFGAIFLPALGIAANNPAPRSRPECGVNPKSVMDAPEKSLEDGYKYIGECAYDGNWKRVEKNPQLKKMLKFLSGKVNRQIEVYSCFRSEESQERILCNNSCAPRYGKNDCTGLIADPKKAPSQHTTGTAADIFMLEFEKNPKALCNILAEMRTKVNGGRGGISNYGSGAGHVDVHPDWCNWGVCEKFLGEGFCRRTKYNVKKTELNAKILDAEASDSKARVERLKREIGELEREAPLSTMLDVPEPKPLQAPASQKSGAPAEVPSPRLRPDPNAKQATNPAKPAASPSKAPTNPPNPRPRPKRTKP